MIQSRRRGAHADFGDVWWGGGESQAKMMKSRERACIAGRKSLLDPAHPALPASATSHCLSYHLSSAHSSLNSSQMNLISRSRTPTC